MHDWVFRLESIFRKGRHGLSGCGSCISSIWWRRWYRGCFYQVIAKKAKCFLFVFNLNLCIIPTYILRKSMSIEIRFAFKRWGQTHEMSLILNYCATTIYQHFLPFFFEESILKCKLGKTYPFNLYNWPNQFHWQELMIIKCKSPMLLK